MSRRTKSPVPDELRQRIDDALAEVDAARSDLDQVLATQAPLGRRRAAHHRMRQAYLAADRQLREATHLAKQHSRWEWMQWRRELTMISTARQHHLFMEQDSSCVLPVCAVQTLDTGMSAPAIGELQHGEAAMPGATAEYGVDMEHYCLHHDCA